MIVYLPLNAQYYFRGEVKDDTQKPLANARLMLHSSGFIYYSGTYGGFGITSVRDKDSLSISLDGYLPTTILLDAKVYATISLKPIPKKSSGRQKRLMSVTRNLTGDTKSTTWTVGGETYSTLVENEFQHARDFPETVFAINTDKASYSNIRRFVNMGSTVPPDAVRIEEMLNYFNFGYEAPTGDSLFHFSSALSDCPWNPGNQLLYIKSCARKLDMGKVPPSNLVFLIDVSGSMDMPNRLPLLKSAFKLMVENLRAEDTVSIVVYGSTVGVWLTPTSGVEKEKIRKSIEELYPGGATPGESGILTAYRLARSQFIPGGNNRVILATDGDFNIGQTSEEELEKMISQQQQSGIYLTCLGVGMGNYKDSKLEVLAKKGNGNFAYLDDEKEAEKVLVKELTQTMYTVVDDALLNIRFNAQKVNAYRLIGFDNRKAAASDTSSVLEGGELGSGHTTFAIFELEPTADSLNGMEKIADLAIQYRNPSDSARHSLNYPIVVNRQDFNQLPSSYRMACGVALFGSLLKGSHFVKQQDWIGLQTIITAAASPDDVVQQEFVSLVDKAKKIYVKGKQARGRGGAR
ncbi:VWA domain-containing protein [Flavihumibacter rivuli]|uniref:vWA domain-containing protein n=1 Tax=Flavihumibacter rivuli TaxID=2838156 RepID=UPI001BDEA0AD|nr:VWA domain-containing protein [Flavihumibacter rivuli]ULQ58282.1 VWA domain-containing protein [Flavihumibacter rivuli]